MVCTECDLKGDITIGKNTVVHPKAQIIAEAGPIIIGENNLIEEQVQIINKYVCVVHKRLFFLFFYKLFSVTDCRQIKKKQGMLL